MLVGLRGVGTQEAGDAGAQFASACRRDQGHVAVPDFLKAGESVGELAAIVPAGREREIIAAVLPFGANGAGNPPCRGMIEE